MEHIRTPWNTVVNFLNTKELGSRVSRKSIIKEVYKHYHNPKYGDGYKEPIDESLIDRYIKIINGSKFLYKPPFRCSLYIVNKRIPECFEVYDVIKIYKHFNSK